MSLRLKVVAALVLLSAAATISIGVSSYVSTSERLNSEVDNSLAEAARFEIGRHGFGGFGGGRPGGGNDFDRPRSFQQFIEQVLDKSGSVVSVSFNGHLPVSASDRAVAAITSDGDDAAVRRRDVHVNGEHYRMLTASFGGANGGAVQVARSLAETDRLLDSLRNRAFLAVLFVVTAAAAVGWLLARQITRRLVRLTATAEEVAATGSLDVPVSVGGRDEAGRLGTAFNGMLVALARSKDAQQRLVQDAGHELRTPLTSLRTNVSVMRRYESLSSDQRARLLDDLDGETRELTELVNELVELATDRRSDEPAEAVELATIVERAAERTRRRSGREIVVRADHTTRTVRPQAIERAIGNLLDNAAKFDTGSVPIEVSVDDGRIVVCDHGPGISVADEPHVFDRFYRSIEARSRPGSGLGLAIVRDIVEAHGGSVFAQAHDGGGACVGFVLPANP